MFFVQYCTPVEIYSQYLKVLVLLGGILRSLTGYEPSNCIKKFCVTWTIFEMIMALPHEKIFANIPQLMSEKDWLVWKFQVQYAQKAAGQWEFITGTADTEARDYESKRQKAFYSVLQCIGQKYIHIYMVMSCQTPKEMCVSS